MKVETNEWYELNLECNGRLLMLQRDATLDDARKARRLRTESVKCAGNVYRIVKVTETRETVE